MELTFQNGDEIYKNGLVHIFSYVYEQGNKQKHSEDIISVEFKKLQYSLTYNKLVISGSDAAVKAGYELLFKECDEKPLQTKNFRYYYDEKKNKLVWSPKILYVDMNKLKPYQRKEFNDKRLKDIRHLIETQRGIDDSADITEREKKERKKALDELIIKNKNVFVFKTPEQLYQEAILSNRDFSKKIVCDCCKNEFYTSGEFLDTSKYYNMSPHARFFEFNDSKNQEKLCVFCYLFYLVGNSDKNLVRVRKYKGVFNSDLLSLFNLRQLLVNITNKTGNLRNLGYNMDKYFIKTEDSANRLPHLFADGLSGTTLSLGYVLFNYFTKEDTKIVDFGNLELIIYQEDGVLKVSHFNKFRYLFQLFNNLDMVYTSDTEGKKYPVPLFIDFFSKLFVNSSQKPFREIIAMQIITENKFFDILSELFYEKFFDKKRGKPVANIPLKVLNQFLVVYIDEVIKMDKDKLETAKEIGEKIGKFAQETKDLELIYKLREFSSPEKFIEYLRNSQYKAIKSEKMIFSNEELDIAVKLAADTKDSEFKDKIDLVSCYAIQKYLAKDFVQSKKEGKQ